ncbi:hypothetical protein CCP3SC1_350023 [Gammaproteobacteria bacterium]
MRRQRLNYCSFNSIYFLNRGCHTILTNDTINVNLERLTKSGILDKIRELPSTTALEALDFIEILTYKYTQKETLGLWPAVEA